MTRYFFDVDDGVEAVDIDGRTLPSMEDARAHAMRIAVAYAGRPELVVQEGGAIVVSVRTGGNEGVLTVRLSFNIEAVPPR